MTHHHSTALLLLPLLSSTSIAATGNETEPISLAEALLVEEGPSVGGWLEASYNDFSGNFAVGRNRIHVSGDFEGYGYEISVGYDDASSSFGLRDAYATAAWGSVDWAFGQFRAPTTSGHLVDETGQFFMDRTGFGGAGRRQTGFMGSGSFDNFGWAVAMMDDEVDDDEDLHARVSFDVIGGTRGKNEGAYDYSGTTNLSVAVALDSGEGGDTTYVEATMANGPLWAHVELADAETASPFTLAATYAINTQYEVGVRSADSDDGSGATMSIAVNRYFSGHSCKWVAQFDDGDDYDGDTSEDQRLSTGFLLSF